MHKMRESFRKCLKLHLESDIHIHDSLQPRGLKGPPLDRKSVV